MPAYQDYISKTQLTRVVGELAAAKTATDAALFEGKTPVVAPNNKDLKKEDIGLGDAKTPRSNLLSAVAVSGFDATNPTKGTVVGTLGSSANKDIAGATVTHARSTDGVWTCHVQKGKAKGFKDKFIPTGCANTAPK